MNRFAAAGITFDAMAGRRILVVTVNERESTEALNALAQAADAAGCPVRVIRARGAERIDYLLCRGRVTIRSHRQGGHGLSADTVFLDAGVDAELRSPHDFADFAVIVGASPTGEVIRA